jgi:hypothetical protein
MIMHVERLDYEGKFATIAKMFTIEIILYIATQHGWKIHPLDVKNAFLNDNLKEVYMEQTIEFVAKC